MTLLKEVFGADKPIIGMLHLTGYGREAVLENAKREIGYCWCFYRENR